VERFCCGASPGPFIGCVTSHFQPRSEKRGPRSAGIGGLTDADHDAGFEEQRISIVHQKKEPQRRGRLRIAARPQTTPLKHTIENHSVAAQHAKRGMQSECRTHGREHRRASRPAPMACQAVNQAESCVFANRIKSPPATVATVDRKLQHSPPVAKIPRSLILCLSFWGVREGACLVSPARGCQIWLHRSGMRPCQSRFVGKAAELESQDTRMTQCAFVRGFSAWHNAAGQVSQSQH
jgi:hypothetical protein